MTARSKLITLMAQREASEIANARRAFAHVVQEQQAAQSMTQRLSALLDQRREEGREQMSVAELRQHRHLSSQLAAEAERTRLRAAQMQAEVDAAMANLSRKKHRKQVLDEAALTARKAEAQEQEQRREAARIPYTRRP